MKNTLIALATLVASIALSPLSSNAQSAEKLKPGDDLPVMESQLQNANGKPVTLRGEVKQNGLLVMFSCNTCPFVVKNQPVTRKVMDYAITHNVGMVVINSNEAKRGDDDSYAAMMKYARAQGYAIPYVVDEKSKLADMFGANHTPEVFLFSNKGKLIYKGAMNDNPSDPGSAKKMYVADAIDAMIAGKPVDPASTKSIGCSIKRKV